MTEARALRAMQRGSEDALGWFIERYTPYVSTVIYNIIGGAMGQADLEEVASDVFLLFWNHAGQIHPASIRAWLGAVARNLAKNRFRQAGRSLPLDEDLILIDEEGPEVLLEHKERDRMVRETVLAMGWPEREIFLRYYYYGQTVKEIAGEMAMPESTVKTKLRRGRERLKSTLTEKGGRYGI